MDVILDFTFLRNYEVKVLPAAPPVHPLEKLYHYPVEQEEGERAGIYVRVEPQGSATWTGLFAEGFESQQTITTICSCPDPDSVCIVAAGYAYVVNVGDPAQWVRIEQRPVTALHVLKEQRLILFAGFTSITALGDSGIKWTTARLSWEGIKLTEIAGDKLRGLGWNAISDREVAFEVDLRTGQHLGGSSPRQG